MECAMETPLDVLSRAATMLQKEEREAAIKRSAGHPDSPHNDEMNRNDNIQYKRCRASPTNEHHSEDDRNSSDDDETGKKKCMATQTAFSSFHDRPVSPVKPPVYTPPPPPPYSSIDTSHIPWQPFLMNPAMPHTSTLPGYPLPSRHLSPHHHHQQQQHLPTSPIHNPSSDNSMPLNLSTNKSSSTTDPTTSDRPSVIVAPNGNCSSIGGEPATGSLGGGNDSRTSSPGVPERLLHGRPMTTATGSVFYPSTVCGANLAGLEARTTRKEAQPDICDPSIEEHFRRSLGTAYTNYMSRSSSSSPPQLSPSNPSPPHAHRMSPTHPSPPPRLSPSPTNSVSSSRKAENKGKVKLVSVSGTVDDHFAKALGNHTWNKIKVESESKDSESGSVDDHFAKALGATWHQIQAQRKAKQQT